MVKEIKELPKEIVEKYGINIEKDMMSIYNPYCIHIKKPYTIQKMGNVSYHIGNDEVCIILWIESSFIQVTVYG